MARLKLQEQIDKLADAVDNLMNERWENVTSILEQVKHEDQDQEITVVIRIIGKYASDQSVQVASVFEDHQAAVEWVDKCNKWCEDNLNESKFSNKDGYRIFLKNYDTTDFPDKTLETIHDVYCFYKAVKAPYYEKN